MSGSNPFAALINDAINTESKKVSGSKLNTILENIFAFSLNESVAKNKGYVYLGESEQQYGEDSELNLNNLSGYLFERLFNSNLENSLISSINRDKFPEVHSTECLVIKYLYACFIAYNEQLVLFDNENESRFVKNEILRNLATAFINPDIYFEQKLLDQLVLILNDEGLFKDIFFHELGKAILDNEDGGIEALKIVFSGLIDKLTNEVIKTPLSTFDFKIFSILKLFLKEEIFASVFMDCIQPKRPEVGYDYSVTLLGAIFNINILPKTPSGKCEHFHDPVSKVAVETTEGILWDKVNLITENLHSFILTLLKTGPNVKEKTLKWLGHCLQQNSDREKLISQAPPELNPASYTSTTDGFMIQFSNVLVRLCQPFCSETKILKVDPTYCAVPNDKLSEKQIHLADMAETTCLVPNENSEPRLMAESFNFISECFYLAHRAIHLGYCVAVNKAVRMNHELGRAERALAQMQREAWNETDMIERIQQKMKHDMSIFLSYEAQLTEPNLLKGMFELMTATSHWLYQVVVHRTFNNDKSYAPLEPVTVDFSISPGAPPTLRCIPEFIVDNLISFLVFLMRYSPKEFEEQGYKKMEPLLTIIITLMGNHELVRNPHLRAQMAEAVEAFLPFHREEIQFKNNMGNFQRTALFANYPFKKQVVQSLLQVFVEIEMTGQSVEFEQKFNYRRPMYAVMECLWEKEEYQVYFRELAVEAERNMEAVNPPLFLRFINLLINDAIFLLDESLSNMAKLRELQTAKDNGAWDALSAQERGENMRDLNHTGMIARFDNILGKDTIGALEKLTSAITIVFTHSTMVDRMASMLNYFLLNLVGPNKKNFKVKDPKEFHFDPAQNVLAIVKIYVNLRENDAFCLAISQDGRSYSPQLFTQAETVLVKIGGSILVQELQELAEKVAKKAKEYQANEEVIAEAPDNYLDPIMSTLMLDPVILPSSRKTVDRTTIARHLLSDQTDPFNRSPLSMDQVIPNIDLANEIKAWIEERRSR